MFFLWNFVWGIPQSVISLLLYLCLAPFVDHTWYRSACFFHWGHAWGAVTLGWVVITDDDWWGSGSPQREEGIFAHEYGHVIESAILGPLWLFVITVPSLIHAQWWKSHTEQDYYSFYTERWASKLGNSTLV